MQYAVVSVEGIIFRTTMLGYEIVNSFNKEDKPISFPIILGALALMSKDTENQFDEDSSERAFEIYLTKYTFTDALNKYFGGLTL